MRKRYTPAYKAESVLEVLKEAKTLTPIVTTDAACIRTN